MPKQLITMITLVSLYSLPERDRPCRTNNFIPRSFSSRQVENTSCPTCQAFSQKNDPLSKLDDLSTLGRRTQVNPFLPLRRSMFDGFSVDLKEAVGGRLESNALPDTCGLVTWSSMLVSD